MFGIWKSLYCLDFICIWESFRIPILEKKIALLTLWEGILTFIKSQGINMYIFTKNHIKINNLSGEKYLELSTSVSY